MMNTTSITPSPSLAANPSIGDPYGSDSATGNVLAALSGPLPTDPTSMNRRRFLQALAAGATVAALPAWLSEPAAAAGSLGPRDGVLVLITMAGGNDGLNTFVPVASGRYHDARGPLAIRPDHALPMGGGRGLNPNLPFLKHLWDRGDLAVIDGVGHPASTLSHFVSMGEIMTAHAGTAPMGTGWLGRYTDGLAGNPFNGVSLGTSIPLLAKGRRGQAIGLPPYSGGIFKTRGVEPTYVRQYATLRSMGVGPTGLGPLADAAAAAGRRAVDLSRRVQPLMEDRSSEPDVITRLRLAARLINANVGIRFISIVYGDFDSHADQTSMHRDRMRELNTGLQVFFAALNHDFVDRTLIVGTSEFGRRVNFNGSGTDHGAANSLFAIGTQVNKGFFGQMPSLDRLDEYGNPVPTVDYRQFYANILTTWLGADSAEVIGRDYGDIGFLNRPASRRTPIGSTPSGQVPVRARRAQIARLFLAFFGHEPDEETFEAFVDQYLSGARSLPSVANALAQSPGFVNRYGALSDRRFVELAYRNVFARTADAGGLTHWTRALASGTSRGDMMLAFSESSEFVTKTADRVLRMELTGRIGRLYRAYFLRKPDLAGLDYWLNTRLDLASISNNFADSQEFKQRYGRLDNGRFVELIYRNVLGRAAEASGRRYWIGQLADGRSRGEIMIGFSNSDEFRARVKRLT